MSQDPDTENRPRVGLIGLGRMGSVLLPRLLNGGLPVTVWNRSQAKMQAAAEIGARLATSLPELCRDADIILTIVFDDAALKDVFLAPSGLLSRRCHGKLFIDLSTIRPGTAREIAEGVNAADASFLNAAVCGSVAPAMEGKLLTLVAGARSDYERARSVLALFSRAIEFVGPVGAASAMKLVIQLPIYAYWQSLSEALVLGRQSGLDLRRMLSLLADSPAALPALPSKIATILQDNGIVSFDLASASKDLGLMRQEARDFGLELATTNLVAEYFDSAIQNGWADRDVATIVSYGYEKANIPSQAEIT